MPESVSVPVPTFSREPGPGEQPQKKSAITPLTVVERLLLPTVSVLNAPM
jgi:hypothetical protein